MYLRFTSRTNADGSVVRYVALAHNRRVGGKIKPDVLMNLGRVDQVDVEGLHRLAASINKHFGDDGHGTGAEAGLAAAAASLEVVDSRSIGAVWLLDGLWRRLDVAAAVRAAADARRFTTNMERVLFALVANRAVAPMSKLSAAGAASNWSSGWARRCAGTAAAGSQRRATVRPDRPRRSAGGGAAAAGRPAVGDHTHAAHLRALPAGSRASGVEEDRYRN
ncbi:hypothetical protein ABGB16_32190 [Micromonospora sp. B11E3]|uniref:hypothetical protein n=1 Tax=Micromonospora sp. B11E3 TaxID=3153562 RepID=UPI00325C91BD